MQLQWGGRAFSRSRFGACVGDGMQKVGGYLACFFFWMCIVVVVVVLLTGDDRPFHRILPRRIYLYHFVLQ